MQISGYCPHCGNQTAITPAALVPMALREGMGPALQLAQLKAAMKTDDTLLCYQEPHARGMWWMGKCNYCSRPLVVHGTGDWILPELLPEPVDERIPEPMRTDLREAKQNLVVRSYNSAAVMARRALQSLALKRGATPKKSLQKQLDQLRDQHVITAEQHDNIQAARWLGNDGAHPEPEEIDEDGIPFVTGVEKQDAEEAIEMVEELCRSLFVASAIAERMKQRRNKD